MSSELSIDDKREGAAAISAAVDLARRLAKKEFGKAGPAPRGHMPTRHMQEPDLFSFALEVIEQWGKEPAPPEPEGGRENVL